MTKKLSKIKHAAAAALGLLTLVPVAGSLWYAGRLADVYTLPPGQTLTLHTALPIRAVPAEPVAAAASAGGSSAAQLRLFGILPIKTVNMQHTGTVWLVPSGEPFGCRMLMDGIMVIGFGEVFSEEGVCCPAVSCGLQEGDVIRAVGADAVTCTADFREETAQGEPMTLTVDRAGETLTLTLEPAYDPALQVYQTGLWVRDSTAGIGTMTYYAPDTGAFGGLGHPICDPDTGQIIPLASGEADSVTVSGAVPGTPGSPGCLQGYFTADASLGTLTRNAPCGVFGVLDEIPPGEAVPMAFKQEVETGDAVLLTTVEGTEPQAYTVRITEIDQTSPVQNMVIEVTDAALLAKTGGIVQGMSGSPILQNGKLVGAVTHVFVREPSKGYGVFAENMLG